MFCRSVVGLLVEPGYVPTAAGKFFKNPASSPDSPWLASALAAASAQAASQAAGPRPRLMLLLLPPALLLPLLSGEAAPPAAISAGRAAISCDAPTHNNSCFNQADLKGGHFLHITSFQACCALCTRRGNL